MSYIPKDDEQQQSGMNVLGQPQQNQQQQQNAQNQPQQTSGGQSASIASGQPQQAPQGDPKPPQAPKKQAKSGMFTNIRKYMERNKPGAQQMSGKMQQNISQQNQNIQQAIGKQKTDFMSRVNQNRARMDQARSFGQDVVNRGQNQVDQNQLQAQQQQLQNRIGAFGENNDQNVQAYQQYMQGFQQQPQQPVQGQEQQAPQQPMSFEDYTKQQLDYSGAQTGLTESQQAYQQAVGNIQGLQDSLSGLNVIQERGGVNFTHRGLESYGPTYYNQDAVQTQLEKPSDKFLNDAAYTLSEQMSQITKNAPKNIFGTAILNQQQKAQLAELKQKRDSIESYRKGVSEAQTAQTEAEKRLTGIQTQLAESKEAQRLFENKRGLEAELATLEDKIKNAPEQLTDEEVERFNNLRTGIERFDDAILNLSQQQAQTQDLAAQAESLGTSQGRRDMLRKQFGAKGGYSAGQAALDNLIMTGDKQGMRDLIQNTKEQAKEAQASLRQAFKEGRITQDEMRRGSENLRKDLQASVDEAQAALVGGSKEYRDLTSKLSEAEAKLNDETLTVEEREAAQAEVDALREQASAFEGEDIGLTGRARRGEGTFLKTLQDKLEKGQGLSAQEMATLGIDPNDPYAILPEEMLRNIQIDPETFSIQDVATSQDVARASALARLAGGKPEDYLQKQMGLGQDALDKIKKRDTLQEGEEYASGFEDLSSFERDKLKGVLESSETQREDFKTYSKNIEKAKRAAQHALGERSKEGGGTPHWKYWNHYYVMAQQEVAKNRNRIKGMMNEGNMVRSESASKQDVLRNYLKKYRK